MLEDEALSLTPEVSTRDFWLRIPIKASYELLGGDLEAAAASMRAAFVLRDPSLEDPTTMFMEMV